MSMVSVLKLISWFFLIYTGIGESTTVDRSHRWVPESSTRLPSRDIKYLVSRNYLCVRRWITPDIDFFSLFPGCVGQIFLFWKIWAYAKIIWDKEPAAGSVNNFSVSEDLCRHFSVSEQLCRGIDNDNCLPGKLILCLMNIFIAIGDNNVFFSFLCSRCCVGANSPPEAFSSKRLQWKKWWV